MAAEAPPEVPAVQPSNELGDNAPNFKNKQSYLLLFKVNSHLIFWGITNGNRM